MNPDDFPAPQEGFVITHFLVVSDQDRASRVSEAVPVSGEALRLQSSHKHWDAYLRKCR
jgi:hypothetical protein